MKPARVAAGFSIAFLNIPAVVLSVFSLLYVIRSPDSGRMSYASVVQDAVGFSVYAMVLALVVTVVVGIPALVFFLRRGWTSLGSFLILGVMLGTLPFVLFDLYVTGFEMSRALSYGWGYPVLGIKGSLERLSRQFDGALMWGGLGLACGVPAAACFWYVAIRPEQVAKN